MNELIEEIEKMNQQVDAFYASIQELRNLIKEDKKEEPSTEN